MNEKHFNEMIKGISTLESKLESKKNKFCNDVIMGFRKKALELAKDGHKIPPFQLYVEHQCYHPDGYIYDNTRDDEFADRIMNLIKEKKEFVKETDLSIRKRNMDTTRIVNEVRKIMPYVSTRDVDKFIAEMFDKEHKK